MDVLRRQLADPGQTSLTVPRDEPLCSRGAITLFTPDSLTSCFLTKLDVSWNEIRNDGCLALSRALKLNRTINTLNLASNKLTYDALFDETIKNLFTNKQLTSLNLNGNSIGHQGASSVRQYLASNTTLQTLNLGNNAIENQGLEQLVACFRRRPGSSSSSSSSSSSCNQTLTCLNLSGNNIENLEGGRLIADILRSNSALQVLDLSENDLVDQGGTCILECLSYHNTSLVSLSLADNSITSDSATDCARCLQNHPSLQELDLSLNGIQDEGIISIASSLPTNTVLLSLALTGTQFTNEGAIALGNALQINSTLQTLILAENEITDLGMEAILSALSSNLRNNLTELDISDNSHEAAISLLDHLKWDFHIKRAGLCRNELGDEDASHIAALVQHNTVLTSLNLKESKFSNQGLTTIAEAFVHNTSMQECLLYKDASFAAEDPAKFIYDTVQRNRGVAGAAQEASQREREAEVRVDMGSKHHLSDNEKNSKRRQELAARRLSRRVELWKTTTPPRVKAFVAVIVLLVIFFVVFWKVR
eukprot:TRINITY_DN93764_c0_g1_i1.p1 TRINITY_DN93764_c0_g1~~TRINITY_DN93764_c0_g1_i1.p1  ORF type:complete len:536 (+),score=16.36 TRINITY_DN93764_c0_g1_i1:28-1635(+)